MPENKKKPGLSKEISSIFAGLPEVDNGRGGKPDLPGAPTPDPAEKSASPPAITPRTFSEEIIRDGIFPRRRNALVGLDIGPSSIILVQVYPVASGWEIGGYAIKENRMVQDEDGLEEKDSLLEDLKEVVAATGYKRGSYLFTLRGDSINTSLVPLVRMPQKELDSACRLEVKRRVSFNVEKAIIRSQMVSETTARPGGKVNYLVTVARREMIRRRMAILQEANLRAEGLLPLPFAWKYLLTQLDHEEKSVAIVEIGSNRTLVVVYKDNEIKFSREFETGGDQITEAIIQAGLSFGGKVKMSWEDAERLKRESNILDAPPDKIIKDGVNSGQLISMIRPVLERVVQEARRSLDYYSQLFRGEEVEKVYLSGGGALLPGLVDFVQERFHSRVSLFSRPQRIGLHSSLSQPEKLEKLFPRMAKAVAAALARKPEMNFMPFGDRLMENILHRKAPVAILAGAALLFSFFYYHLQTAPLPSLRKKIAIHQSSLTKLNQQLQDYQVLAALKNKLQAREKLGQYSSLRQPNWIGILKEVSRIIPPNIILSRLYLEEDTPQRLVCEGRITKIDKSLDSELSGFLVRMGDSPFFKEVTNVSLDTSENSKSGDFRFKCVLVY